jgi:hypothetical protein
MKGRPPVPIERRFWQKVWVPSAKACWPWQGAKDRQGYGFIKRKDGVQYRAHRLSYEMYQGPIPPGGLVCHHCDNPSCVNPNHLFVGTPVDNARDMVRKNRHCRLCGEKNPMAKLTDAQVIQIRRDKRSHINIAKDFAISVYQIKSIRSGRCWKHLITEDKSCAPSLNKA